tara:strand:+ start:1748 stop:2608 length:861 start_codon:yes stop_codon:yes gene_type:complete
MRKLLFILPAYLVLIGCGDDAKDLEKENRLLKQQLQQAREDKTEWEGSSLYPEALSPGFVPRAVPPSPEVQELILAHIRKAKDSGATTLDLRKNQIIDLKPLEGFTNLRTLSLAHNQISDLKPLAGLTNLEDLNLSGNRPFLSDLTPLSRLTKLKKLNLSYNQITDLSPLKELTNLKELNLCGNNAISNITPLAGLTHLVELKLVGVYGFSDFNALSPLFGLTNLKELSLSLNHDKIILEKETPSLSPLKMLTQLKSLYVDDFLDALTHVEKEMLRKALPDCEIRF